MNRHRCRNLEDCSESWSHTAAKRVKLRVIRFEIEHQAEIEDLPQGDICMEMEPPVKLGPEVIYPVAVPGVTKLI